MTVVQFPVAAVMGSFSIRHRDKTGSGTHGPSFAMGTGGSYSGDKAAGVWSWLQISI
jgi:hypothetical protein